MSKRRQESAGDEVKQEQEGDANNPARNRRRTQAEVARRRAAHFATFAPDVDDGATNNGSNPHVGGDAASGLGPWSSAVQLHSAREKERERRADKILEGARAGQQDAAQQWKPTRDLALGPRTPSPVAPLSHTCLRLVVGLIDQVETLWGLPELVKSKVAAEVCARRALTADTVRLFTEHSPAEVCVPDCSQLDAEALTSALLEGATPNLERLVLGFCGRGLTDAAAEAVAKGGVLSALTCLRLSGAYRLSDAGLVSLLSLAPVLQELAMAQCSRLEGPAIERLPELTPKLKVLNLAQCRGVSAATLTTAIASLPLLEELTVDGIMEIDDAALTAIAAAAPKLLAVSLASCSKVSDAGVSALAAACPQLRRLVLDECHVGPVAVQAVAAQCRNLETISLARCHAVDDAAVTALVALGSLRCVSLNGAVKVTGPAVLRLALACKGSLQELDLSWCRGVDAATLGAIADACPALERLELWGCTQADDSFLLGHSNDGLLVVGRGEIPLPVVL